MIDEDYANFEVLAEVQLSGRHIEIGILSESGDVGYKSPEFDEPRVLTPDQCDLLRAALV